MYENRTNETIHADMLLNMRDDIDKREGSLAFDMTAPAAIETSLLYMELDAILALGFAETSEGEWLERRTAELGVLRKPAIHATGVVTISGDEGVFIPQKTRLLSDSGEYFITQVDATIGPEGEASVEVEAVAGGAEGNVGAGEIVAIEGDLSGVVEVTNNAAFVGGVDVEDDVSLLTRYLERVRRPATSGNAAHYVQWAKEVPGVGQARVFPLWNGAGTVKVVIVDDSKRPASPELVAKVSEYIESVRPIGAEVTVESSPGKAISATAKVRLAEGALLSNVLAEYRQTVTDYLESIAFIENYVSYAKLGSLLLSTPGVIDYEDLTANGLTSNIALELDEAPFLEMVELGVVV